MGRGRSAMPPRVSHAPEVRAPRRGGECGAALLLVLILVPALALVSAAFLKMAGLEGDRTRAEAQTVQGLYYAEGGVARAAWALTAKGKLDLVDDYMPAGVT